jgi:polyhydroxyalkanoate synthase
MTKQDNAFGNDSKNSKNYATKIKKTIETLSEADNIMVGSTPKEIVTENRLYRLLHYPHLEKKIQTPLLIVYALINKSYILDLQQDKSWIRNLAEQGFDVYLLDWKAPTNADKYVSFNDYVNSYLDESVDLVLNQSSVDKINLQGYCMGATMSTMYASLYQNKVKTLTTISPVVDTANDTTVIGNIARHLDIDKIIDTLGNFPSEKLYECFSILKPFKQGINKYINLIEHIDNDSFVQNFLRIEKWIYDTPPIAGETMRQWINDIYKNNLLFHNKMWLENRMLDLSQIKVPLLNIIAEEDHLVSPDCSAPLNKAVSSEDKQLMRFNTGHVGLIASTYSQHNVLPKVGQWLKAYATC